jgi:glycosyltransferase involved in cell wall biosynthesis
MLDFSVVIPTFRRPGPLAEAIRSALSQPGVSVEVVVVDDSPEGSARPVVEAIGDPRVRYLLNPAPTGGRPAAVRNLGWPGCTGRFVHFLDDDDRAAPGAYWAVAEAFDANPGRGVVFGRVEPFGDDQGAVAREQKVFATSTRRARRFQRLGWRTWVAAHQLFCAPTLLVCSAGLVRREHVAPLGGFDPGLPLVEDVEFYTRAIRRFGFVHLPRPVVEYRTGAPSLMNAHRKSQDDAVDVSYQRMYAKYRDEHGALELMALKVLAKGLLSHL